MKNALMVACERRYWDIAIVLLKHPKINVKLTSQVILSICFVLFYASLIVFYVLCYATIMFITVRQDSFTLRYGKYRPC